MTKINAFCHKIAEFVLKEMIKNKMVPHPSLVMFHKNNKLDFLNISTASEEEKQLSFEYARMIVKNMDILGTVLILDTRLKVLSSGQSEDSGAYEDSVILIAETKNGDKTILRIKYTQLQDGTIKDPYIDKSGFVKIAVAKGLVIFPDTQVGSYVAH